MDVPICIYLRKDIEMEELGNKAPPNPDEGYAARRTSP